MSMNYESGEIVWFRFSRNENLSVTTLIRNMHARKRNPLD